MRFRFSLRGLLIFTVATSILSTVVGLPYAEYRREVAVANRLEELGCWVDWRPSTKHWGADFFTNLGLGQPYWRVVDVEFEEAISNDDLTELKKLSELRRLSFVGSWIDDAGLLHLNKCSSLRHLDMQGNATITDKGLRNLELRELEFLNTAGTRVTYAGLKLIAQQNPMLDAPTSIGLHALRELEQAEFRSDQQIASRSQLRPSDEITVQPRHQNSRQEWYAAAKHLQEFPGSVISQFPEPIESGKEFGLTLDIAILTEDAVTIRSRNLSRTPALGTIHAVALIAPQWTNIARLTGEEVTAWYGGTRHHADNSLEVPADAEVVFVAVSSLPVTVELSPVDRR